MINNTIKFILFTSVFIILFSCKNNEMETKLESAITEIESLKAKSKQDSLSIIKNNESIMDSLNSNTEISLDLSTHYEKLKSSIFVIYTSNDLETYQGTAFLIDNVGTCISNYHVFKNTKSAILENNNGNKYLVEKVIRYDEEDDYILFKINLENEFINPLKISKVNPKIGEECFTIGNPRGLNQTISKGIISGYRSEERLIQTTTEITHGSSGGPLFNNKGEVIGITTSGFGEANLNFAVNINQIKLSVKNENTNETNNYFVVISDKTYFHTTPEINSKRNAYLLKDAIGNVIESRNGFVYIIFKNTRNQISKGWIRIGDIKFI
jgi:S1-C subfamily serine protease